MPDSIEKTFKIMGLKKEDIALSNVEDLKMLKPGSSIKKGNILFKKIESD